MSLPLPVLHVETAHSAYVIDQNAGRYYRTRVHDSASDLSYAGITDGEWVDYDKVVSSLEPGNPVVITHPDGTWVRSTAIQSVREVYVD